MTPLTVAVLAPYLILVGAILVVGTIAYAFVASRTWHRSLLEALFFEAAAPGTPPPLNLSPLIVLMFSMGGIIAGGIEVVFPGRHLSNWGWGFMSGGLFWTLMASIPIDRAKIMADVKKHEADIAPGTDTPTVPVTTTTTVGAVPNG